ncbi:unnamed protein product [Choristocarpus tenellus]
MFLAGMTLPDQANSVRELGRYAVSTFNRHWIGLQHVLRYLAGTIKVGIRYPAGGDMDNTGLVGYGDSDWGNDTDSRQSATRYLKQSILKGRAASFGGQNPMLRF